MGKNNFVPIELGFKQRTPKKAETIKNKEASDDAVGYNYVTKIDLERLEERLEQKINSIFQPLEIKIDDLPNLFEEILLRKREQEK